MNEIVVGVLIVLVGALITGTAYFLLKLFFDNESKKRTWDYKIQNQKITLPLRLQAYERMILFLERISPASLLPRLQNQQMNSRQLQKEILSQIRLEYEHNLSQQLYISIQAWQVINSAKENVIKIVNITSDEVDPNSNSMELSQKILAKWMLLNPTPIQTAIDFLKKEAQQLF
jgi:hypothetical protein